MRVRVGLALMMGLAWTWATQTAPARAENTRFVSGATEPIHSLALKAGGRKLPPWNGRITRVLVKEGQQVDANQVLVEMDKRDEEIELRMRRMIAENQSELQTEVEREHALREIWLSNKAMCEKNRSVSREDVAKKEVEYLQAVCERKRLELVEQRAKLEVEAAKVSLENRSVVAPFKGTVVKLYLHEGDTCEANDPLLQLVDTSRCVFVCLVEEKLGRTLKMGQSVDLKIQAGPTQQKKKGEVVFISPVVDSASSLMTVKIEFDNATGEIRPGVPGVMALSSAGQ